MSETPAKLQHYLKFKIKSQGKMPISDRICLSAKIQMDSTTVTWWVSFLWSLAHKNDSQVCKFMSFFHSRLKLSSASKSQDTLLSYKECRDDLKYPGWWVEGACTHHRGYSMDLCICGFHTCRVLEQRLYSYCWMTACLTHLHAFLWIYHPDTYLEVTFWNSFFLWNLVDKIVH